MSDRNPLSLDVASPDEVVRVLREAADRFYDSANELSSAWQSKDAGKPWTIIARKLERCADQIAKELGPLWS